MNIFERRLIFVVGKGGAGKTTISIALALAALRAGGKVLLVEVGQSDSIGPLFLKGTLPEAPCEIHSGLWGARVNPRTALDEYIHAHVGFSFIANTLMDSTLFNHIAEATPGLKEAVTLGQIWRWEQEQGKNGGPRFNLIIVDAPATGHGVSLLRLPQALIDMLRMGPIADELRIVQNLLKDQQKTCLAVVTLPEELPVKEAIEFNRLAEKELHMPVGVTIMNAVYPDLFTRKETAIIEQMVEADRSQNSASSNRAILETARRHIIRRQLEQFYIDRIKKESSGQVIELPFYFANELTVGEIGDIASLLIEKLNV